MPAVENWSSAEDTDPFPDPNVGREIGFKCYMDLCETTGRRYERHHGVIVAPPEGMAGGSPEHSALKGDLFGTLYSLLREADGPYEPVDSDQALRIEFYRKDVFPDVGAYCGDPGYFVEGRKTSLKNPVLVVEVLSPTTRGYDLGQKFRMYQTLPSLQEYLVVEPDVVSVTLFRRQQTGWLMLPYSSLEDRAELTSVGVTLPVSAIYRPGPGGHR